MCLYKSMLCPNGAIQSINHFLSPDIQSFGIQRCYIIYIFHLAFQNSNWPSYKKLQEGHPLSAKQIDLSEWQV